MNHYGSLGRMHAFIIFYLSIYILIFFLYFYLTRPSSLMCYNTMSVVSCDKLSFVSVDNDVFTMRLTEDIDAEYFGSILVI